jgi:hypothetical protein
MRTDGVADARQFLAALEFGDEGVDVGEHAIRGLRMSRDRLGHARGERRARRPSAPGTTGTARSRSRSTKSCSSHRSGSSRSTRWAAFDGGPLAGPRPQPPDLEFLRGVVHRDVHVSAE